MKQYKDFLIDDEFNIYNAYTKHKIKPFVGSDGYMMVKLNMAHCKTCERVHVIIANCFIENPNHYKYVNHINQNKLDNSLNNLEWCTNSHNVKDYWDKSENHRKHRTPVRAIRNKAVYEFDSIRQMCEKLNLDRHKVSAILKGKRKNYYDYEFSYICETTTETISNK